MNHDLEKMLQEAKAGLSSVDAAIEKLKMQTAQLHVLLDEISSECEALADVAEPAEPAQHSVEVVSVSIGPVSAPAEPVSVQSVEDVVAENSRTRVSTQVAPSCERVDARLISDLRKAIGINDRFRFRHDLFGNDDKLMMDTIDRLNSMESFDEAMNFIRDNFSWSETDDTFNYLLDLLHKRYYK